MDNAATDLVSIIIPMYNSEKHLAESIESALNQTWPNKEIIIVDDGSNDRSYEIAMFYETKNNVTLFRQQNSGSCAARNAGLSLSKGDYIQYLDADDILAPDKIELQLNLLRDLPPGFITSCGWGKFDHNPNEAVFIRQKVWQDLKPVDWLVAAWQGGGMMQTACWLTPRHLIEKAGPWDESLKRNPNDDGEFFCRVLLNSQGVKFCEGARVFYRSHSGLRVSVEESFHAVSSLLGTCVSYERNILKVEKSPRVLEALAANYASFMYRFYESFPELSKDAENRIKDLGFKSIRPVGGKYFLVLASLFGFKNALSIRAFLSGLMRKNKRKP